MKISYRPPGVAVLAALFVLSAVPSLVGTVLFIIDGLAPALSDGIGEGLLINFWAYALGIVGTLFYGVIAVITAYGLWNLMNWGRNLAVFMAIFLLFVIPIGTVAGIVIIWYLRKEEVKEPFVESYLF